MDEEPHKCCFCQEACNPASQACGQCARNPHIYWNMLTKSRKLTKGLTKKVQQKDQEDRE